jgi:PBP4 family serine-type D-alanyl-D-alanine carboxypeptidase
MKALKFIIQFIKLLFIIFITVFLTSSFEREVFAEIPESPVEMIHLPITADVYALRGRIDSVIAEYKPRGFDHGIKVISLSVPQTLYEFQEYKPFVPASNQKVITTAAAFHFLSPSYRWSTDFYVNSDRTLYVRGSGNPFWNDRYTNLRRIFSAIADSLDTHLSFVPRNIILEQGTFSDFQMEQSWRTQNRTRAYSAKPSFLAFYDNTIRVKIDPTSAGAPASVDLLPSAAGWDVINSVITTLNRNHQTFSYDVDSTSNSIEVKGSIYTRSKSQYRSLAIPDPELYALELIKEQFEEYEIETTGEIFYDTITDREMRRQRYRRLFSLSSPPLVSIVNDINKFSHNFASNQLFLTIGNTQNHVWQTENIIKDWLFSNDIPMAEVRMFDGSGLSPHNRATAEAFVYILQLMYQSPHFPEFVNSMPVSGTDGTLRRHLATPLLKGRVYAKSGYIMGARGLTGYITTADGEILAFSILVNRENSQLTYFYEMVEKILTEIALFQRDEVLF